MVSQLLLFCSEDALFPDMAALQERSGRDKKNVRKERKETSLKTLSEEDQCSISDNTLGQESSPALFLPVNSYMPQDKS